MKVRLIALTSVEHDRRISVKEHPVVLGRSSEATVTIEDQWVSRRHCELGEVNGMLVVRDLGSRHGTFVNGRPVSQAHLLPDDKLTVGMTSFVASYRAAHKAARLVGCPSFE